MGEAEVTQFLSSLATRGKVSASTQNQALAALLFLYRNVLRRDLGWLQDVVRAKRPVRLPVVLSREEVTALLRQLRGTPWLMASLMYGPACGSWNVRGCVSKMSTLAARRSPFETVMAVKTELASCRLNSSSVWWSSSRGRGSSTS
jgi:hypothetical protein